MVPREPATVTYLNPDGTAVLGVGPTEYNEIHWEVIDPGKGFCYKYEPKLMFGIKVKLGYTGLKAELFTKASMRLFCSDDWQNDPQWYDNSFTELKTGYAVYCLYLVRK